MEKLSECPVCSGKEFSFLYAYGAPDRIAVKNNICHSCSAVFQSPRPTYDELSVYYAAYSDKSQGASVVTSAVEKHLMAIAELRYNFLKSYLKKGMKVLDVGCGIGQLLFILKNAGMVVQGINPEDKYSSYGRQKFGLDIVTAMFEGAELQENSYDLVIFDHVFEHINDPHSALEKVSSLIMPQGKLFISTNNVLTPHGFLWQNFFLDHAVTYSPATIGYLLAMYGFEIDTIDVSGHVTYEGYHYPYMNVIATYTGRKSELPGDDWEAVSGLLRKYTTEYIKRNPCHFVTYYIRMLLDRYVSEYLGMGVYMFLTRPLPEKWRPKLYNHTLPPKRLY